MLSRIVRHHTVQRTLRECRQYTSQAYKRHTQSLHRPFGGPSTLLSRQMTTSTSGTSDSMLIVAGIGILGATCVFVSQSFNFPYLSNTLPGRIELNLRDFNLIRLENDEIPFSQNFFS